MKLRNILGVAALSLGAAALASPAQAKDLTIGLVLSMSGPFSDYGKQIQNGIETFMAQHGDTVAGRKVKLIIKDDTGIAPAIAQWAVKNDIKSAYILVADYGPGHDAQTQFKKTFTELGGKVLGEVRTPVNTPDYAPFLQRVKEARPDALFFFVPPGSSMVALAKNFREMGLDKMGIKEMGPGDMTDENSLAALGDNALGMITAFHYSDAHNSPENKAFVDAYTKAHPQDRANFMSVGGYDGMQLIYKALEKTGGDASGDAFIAAARGLQWESPRGPIQIDPETRDIIQNEYIRKLERVDGKLQNVEFATFEAVKDPGK